MVKFKFKIFKIYLQLWKIKDIIVTQTGDTNK
jgi:hypothetical protein